MKKPKLEVSATRKNDDWVTVDEMKQEERLANTICNYLCSMGDDGIMQHHHGKRVANNKQHFHYGEISYDCPACKELRKFHFYCVRCGKRTEHVKVALDYICVNCENQESIELSET